MNAFTLGALMLAATLSGCATLETTADHIRDASRQHPAIATTVVALAAGSLGAALQHHHDQHRDRRDFDHRPGSVLTPSCGIPTAVYHPPGYTCVASPGTSLRF